MEWKNLSMYRFLSAKIYQYFENEELFPEDRVEVLANLPKMLVASPTHTFLP